MTATQIQMPVQKTPNNSHKHDAAYTVIGGKRKMGDTPAKAWIPLECSQELGKLSGRQFSSDHSFCVIVSGQATVTQKHQFLSVKEGDSILLDCSYQGTEYSLQWYKQYPGGQPEFMVLRTSPGTEAKDHFEMTLDTNNKTTSLYLKNTQLKDSAVYFCAWEHSGVQCQDQVDQKPIEVVKEGEGSTIACQFNSSNVYFMLWYRHTGERPEFLLTVTSVRLEKHKHFSASFDKQKKESWLNIAKVQMKDAAIYFCRAGDPQQHRDTCCLYKTPPRLMSQSRDEQIFDSGRSEHEIPTRLCLGSYFPVTELPCLLQRKEQEWEIWGAGVQCQDRVDQKPVEVIKEGEDSIISCQFTSNNFYSMHWYRQYPGKEPVLLLTVTSAVLKKHEHFSASFEKQKESRLNIMKVQMKDAVVYFCMAQDAQQHRDTCYLYKNPLKSEQFCEGEMNPSWGIGMQSWT
ncbi:hypothetical protein L345_16019, partial [Ophiophagus hannah]